MKTIIHNKLVRDNIPSIIEKAGKSCKTRILNDQEYLESLKTKLHEELKEFDEAMDIKELADIQEVVIAIVKAKGMTLEEFDKIREDKSIKNGAFNNRIFLESVTEDE